MQFIKTLSLTLAFMALAMSSAMAANATCDEAQTMLGKAVNLLKTEGFEKAKPKFMDKNGEFVDRDLYVFVMDKDGIMLSHSAKPVLIGKTALIYKDADGQEFVKKFYQIKDKGSVDYTWADPVDNKIKKKTTYLEWVGDKLVAVGCYKD